MRHLLLIALSATIFFIACKKDEKKNTTPQPPVASPQDSTHKPADSPKISFLVKTLYSENAFGTDTVHYYYDSLERCTSIKTYKGGNQTITDYFLYQPNLITHTMYTSQGLVKKTEYYINHDLWPDSIYRYQVKNGNLTLPEIETFKYYGSDSFVITLYHKKGGSPARIFEYQLKNGNIISEYSHNPGGHTDVSQGYYTYDHTRLNSVIYRYPVQHLYYTYSKNLPLTFSYSGTHSGQVEYTYTFDSLNRVATRTLTTGSQSLLNTYIY